MQLLLLFFVLPLTLGAKETITVTQLVNEQKILNDTVDFHITDIDNPLNNSTVELSSGEAWLFFDNIRPSDVVSKYASSIRIGSEPLNPNVNGRVCIYAHGTVIIPHGKDFAPLMVFTGDNFTGESTSYALYNFNKTLGTFDNSIRSFKLKRGYMATLANNSDGTGYSRVFLADKEDVNISLLPNELDKKVSFIRVFNWEWVTKKGWCGTDGVENDADLTKSTWFYSWSADKNTTSTLEYVPIKQNKNWPGWDEINQKQSVSHLLGYNEPDHTEQANVSVDVAVQEWPNMLKSGLRVGSPATTDYNWLYSFIDKCKANNYRVDYVAIHAYWGGLSPQQWYDQLNAIYKRTGRPIWITEWNNGANWTTESWPSGTEAQQQKQLSDLKGILNVMDTAHFVERYSIYNWVEDKRTIILNGSLTPAGIYYRDNQSKIAFERTNEVVPIYTNVFVPTLSYTFDINKKNVLLSWSDSNGEMSATYVIERKIGDNEYKEIYRSNDISTTKFTDNPDVSSSTYISYRLKLVTCLGQNAVSNAVSLAVNITSGTDEINFGLADIYNIDWANFFFHTSFIEAPAVVFGAPSYNNRTVLMTYSLKTVTNESFKFKLSPWDYLTNKDLTAVENIPYLALKKGTTQLGNLVIQAATVENVNDAWLSVAFDTPFSTVPVVFVSQSTAKSSYPTVARVRNVTEYGFEVQLRREEAKTGTFTRENINYVAIIPGTATIGDKTINVGCTPDSVIGKMSETLPLEFPEKYQNPIFYAATQTANDNITTALRYMSLSESGVTVFKQRESSASNTSVSKDKVGWIVIDDANNGTGMNFIPTNSNPKVYSDAENKQLYIFTENEIKVEIFNVSGVKVISTTSKSPVNIQELTKGTYLVRVGKSYSTSFLKK